MYVTVPRKNVNIMHTFSPPLPPCHFIMCDKKRGRESDPVVVPPEGKKPRSGLTTGPVHNWVGHTGPSKTRRRTTPLRPVRKTRHRAGDESKTDPGPAAADLQTIIRAYEEGREYGYPTTDQLHRILRGVEDTSVHFFALNQIAKYAVIHCHASICTTILEICPDTRREMVASLMDLEGIYNIFTTAVAGSECNPDFVTFAVQLLAGESTVGKVNWLECVSLIDRFDIMQAFVAAVEACPAITFGALKDWAPVATKINTMILGRFPQDGELTIWETAARARSTLFPQFAAMISRTYA